MTGRRRHAPAPTPVIHLILDPPQPGQSRVELPFAYEVGGVPVASDRPVAALQPFRRVTDAVVIGVPLAPAPIELCPGIDVFRGSAWLGGRWREVGCAREAARYSIAVEGVGRFELFPQSCVARVERLADDVTPALVEETVLGPVLVLALAVRGVWCLHASAVVSTAAGRAIAFAGVSGRGKSTLASALGVTGDGAWRHLADDVLPVTVDPTGPLARPHFPQLKFLPDHQPAASAPAELELAAVYVLGGPTGAEAAPSVRALSRQEAALALIRHTVGSRLFAPELLARHLAAAGALTARVPVRALSYPWTGELSPRVAELLALDAEAA